MAHLLRRAQRRRFGAIIVTDEAGREQVFDWIMCAHCQMTWIPEPGSGKRRGWCMKCQAPLCGKQGCLAECRPWEQQIEEIERRGRA